MPDTDYSEAAKNYLQAVYSGDTTTLNALIADSLVISYPIFEQVIGKQVISGRDEVNAFAHRFSTRWLEPNTTFHEVVSDQQQVVLVWSFSGIASNDSTFTRQSWGGISLIRFDTAGKVILELGEESTPGPYARWKTRVN